MAVKLLAVKYRFNGTSWVTPVTTGLSLTQLASQSGYVAMSSLNCLGFKYVSCIATLANITGSPSSFTYDAKLQVSVDNTTLTDVSSGAIGQLTATGTGLIAPKDITGYSFVTLANKLTFTGGTAPKGDLTVTLILTS